MTKFVGKMTNLPPDAQVWRYLSLATFIDILQNGHMFFPRLQNFEDPYEGSMPMAVRNYLNRSLFPQDDLIEELESEIKTACVGCWHINNGESAAMWKLYAHKSGVAIQSSLRRLGTGFRYEDLTMGCVDYIDFDNARDLSNLHPAFLKRKSFSYEQELRLVVYEPDQERYKAGKYVPIVFEKLVEQVYVSPVEPPWLAEVVRKELEQYAVATEVIHSQLYSKTLT